MPAPCSIISARIRRRSRAFDTESPRGTLKRFHPDITEVVDVTSVADQMKIFDTLGSADASVTVIDVRAGLLSSTLQALSDIGFLEFGARRARSPSRCFTSSGRRSPRSRRSPRPPRFVGDANYFLVKNLINNTTFFEWDPATYNSYFKQIKGAEEITIPKLNEMACEQVEVASVPFVSFIANKNAKGEPANYSFVLRGYVRHWLGNVWGEYDRVKLIDLVARQSGKHPPAGRG